jgi:hypothetical protein
LQIDFETKKCINKKDWNNDMQAEEESEI